MNGVITEETQLYRPSINSKFHLLIDPTKKNYKIVVTDESSVHVIEKNEVQFKYDFLDTKALNYQYYYFGGNNEMLSILNRSKNNITIFNLKTNSISFPSNEEFFIIFKRHLNSVLFNSKSWGNSALSITLLFPSFTSILLAIKPKTI